MDENYFEKIDTEGKAYFLGFLLADGCVSEGKKNEKQNWQSSVSLQIQNRDSKILEIFKNETESNKKIVFLTTRNNCKISLNSDKLCQDLINLGVTPRKTFTAKFPTFDQVPETLIHHFMRGLFDGDGCIYGIKNLRFDICGTFEICGGVTKILHKIISEKDKDKIPRQQDKIFRIIYKRFESIQNIYKFLYHDATIFLSRKKEKFETLIQPLPEPPPNIFG